MGAFDNTLGACLIGVVFAAILYGVTCVQTWYYYRGYPSDPWHLKLLVATVLVLDTCHQVLITHTAYTYLVIDFETQQALQQMVWSLIVEAFFTAFTVLLVQSFLAMRIYALSNKNWRAVGPVLCMAIGEFIWLLVLGVKSFHFTTFAQLGTVSVPSMLSNVFITTTDVVITVLLCYLLHKLRTGLRRSDTMIDNLMLFTINTGLLTSLCAITVLVTLALWPNTFIYISFYFSLGRLYCNCLLSTLNARRAVRGELGTNGMSISFQSVSQSTNNGIIGTGTTHIPNNISIQIDTDQEYVRDRPSALIGDVKGPEIAF